MEPHWPQVLWIVRHGQSAGNVARDAAEAAGLHVIDIADRDIDGLASRLGPLGYLARELAGEVPAVMEAVAA